MELMMHAIVKKMDVFEAKIEDLSRSNQKQAKLKEKKRFYHFLI